MKESKCQRQACSVTVEKGDRYSSLSGENSSGFRADRIRATSPLHHPGVIFTQGNRLTSRKDLISVSTRDHSCWSSGSYVAV